ncbi:hypothetical protein E5S52_23495 [Escherichia coli]|nr:hypothetical protein E5S52_23495 [Escherichia coli]
MAFFYVHYVLIYHTVTSLTYVFVPLDFRPLKQTDPTETPGDGREPDTAAGNASDLRRTVVRGKADAAG